MKKKVVIKETDTNNFDETGTNNFDKTDAGNFDETKTETSTDNFDETKTDTDNVDVVETKSSDDLIESINKRFDEFEKILSAKLDGILSRITARSSDSKEKPEKTQEEIEAEYIKKLKEDTKNI